LPSDDRVLIFYLDALELFVLRRSIVLAFIYEEAEVFQTAFLPLLFDVPLYDRFSIYPYFNRLFSACAH